jgi:aspartate 1-decarboxylase
MEDAEARRYVPRVVFVDSENRVVGTGSDPADALPGTGLLRGDAVHAAGSHDDDPYLVW